MTRGSDFFFTEKYLISNIRKVCLKLGLICTVKNEKIVKFSNFLLSCPSSYSLFCFSYLTMKEPKLSYRCFISTRVVILYADLSFLIRSTSPEDA